MCHVLHLNTFNLDFCVGLPVALLSSIALSAAHFVDDYLLGFAVFHAGSFYSSAFNIWSADFCVLIVCDGEYFVECDCICCFRRESFYKDNVALFDPVLLSACFENGVCHSWFHLKSC